MTNCTIIAMANQKGGTGKTTSAYNLGVALALKGESVLLVDFDPQANLTNNFGISAPDELPLTVHNLLGLLIEGKDLPPQEEWILRHKSTEFGGNFSLIPCNIDLAVDEANLRDAMGGERTLLELLEPLRPCYDYIIIDTCPAVGQLTINAMTACDKVVIPVSPNLWSITGLTALIGSVMKIKRKLNPRIDFGGILLTMCDKQTNLYKEAKSLLQEHFGDKIKIYKSEIPKATRVGEACYYSSSIIELYPKSPAALAYLDFAKEVMGDEKITKNITKML